MPTAQEVDAWIGDLGATLKRDRKLVVETFHVSGPMDSSRGKEWVVMRRVTFKDQSQDFAMAVCYSEGDAQEIVRALEKYLDSLAYSDE